MWCPIHFFQKKNSEIFSIPLSFPLYKNRTKSKWTMMVLFFLKNLENLEKTLNRVLRNFSEQRRFLALLSVLPWFLPHFFNPSPNWLSKDTEIQEASLRSRFSYGSSKPLFQENYTISESHSYGVLDSSLQNGTCPSLPVFDFLRTKSDNGAVTIRFVSCPYQNRLRQIEMNGLYLWTVVEMKLKKK